MPARTILAALGLLLLAVGLALALAGCRSASAPPQGARGDTRASAPSPSARAKVDAALERYADLLRRMDSAGIAALFAPEGEIENPGADPIRGPAAILAFLETFKDFHVESYDLDLQSTVVNGRSATQSGTYRQRVRVPAGAVIEVHGRFTAEWVEVSEGQWRILRMGTESTP
jgi:ketosteroid isomerase-like protein